MIRILRNLQLYQSETFIYDQNGTSTSCQVNFFLSIVKKRLSACQASALLPKRQTKDQRNVPFSAFYKRIKFLLLNRKVRSESEQEVGMRVQSKRSPQLR